MKNKYKDGKSAAAGDDSGGEGAQLPFGGLRALLASSSTSRVGQSMPKVPAPVKTRPVDYFQKSWKTVTVRDIYDVGHKQAEAIMNAHPADKMLPMLRKMCDETTISVAFGPNRPGNGVPLANGYIYGHELQRQVVEQPLSNTLGSSIFLTMEEPHPYVRKLTLDRSVLIDPKGGPLQALLIEVGFSLKIKERDTIGTYLGKMKVMFPKNFDKMNLYFDLSKRYVR